MWKTVTGYLNTFGVTVADRIRNQFLPLFDPATEPLSEEILAINDCIQQRAGYSLYDAQLAVAEAVKRQLDRRGTALIIAECGSGKTKIGSTAIGALHGLWASQHRHGAAKSFWRCHVPLACESKMGAGDRGKHCRTPTAWWCGASQTSIACTACMSREIKAYSLSFPRKRPGMAICVTRLSHGTA